MIINFPQENLTGQNRSVPDSELRGGDIRNDKKAQNPSPPQIDDFLNFRENKTLSDCHRDTISSLCTG